MVGGSQQNKKPPVPPGPAVVASQSLPQTDFVITRPTLQFLHLYLDLLQVEFCWWQKENNKLSRSSSGASSTTTTSTSTSSPPPSDDPNTSSFSPRGTTTSFNSLSSSRSGAVSGGSIRAETLLLTQVVGSMAEQLLLANSDRVLQLTHALSQYAAAAAAVGAESDTVAQTGENEEARTTEGGGGGASSVCGSSLKVVFSPVASGFYAQVLGIHGIMVQLKTAPELIVQSSVRRHFRNMVSTLTSLKKKETHIGSEAATATSTCSKEPIDVLVALGEELGKHLDAFKELGSSSTTTRRRSPGRERGGVTAPLLDFERLYVSFSAVLGDVIGQLLVCAQAEGGTQLGLQDFTRAATPPPPPAPTSADQSGATPEGDNSLQTNPFDGTRQELIDRHERRGGGGVGGGRRDALAALGSTQHHQPAAAVTTAAVSTASYFDFSSLRRLLLQKQEEEEEEEEDSASELDTTAAATAVLNEKDRQEEAILDELFELQDVDGLPQAAVKSRSSIEEEELPQNYLTPQPKPRVILANPGGMHNNDYVNNSVSVSGFLETSAEKDYKRRVRGSTMMMVGEHHQLGEEEGEEQGEELGDAMPPPSSSSGSTIAVNQPCNHHNRSAIEAEGGPDGIFNADVFPTTSSRTTTRTQGFLTTKMQTTPQKDTKNKEVVATVKLPAENNKKRNRDEDEGEELNMEWGGNNTSTDEKVVASTENSATSALPTPPTDADVAEKLQHMEQVLTEYSALSQQGMLSSSCLTAKDQTSSAKSSSFYICQECHHMHRVEVRGFGGGGGAKGSSSCPALDEARHHHVMLLLQEEESEVTAAAALNGVSEVVVVLPQPHHQPTTTTPTTTISSVVLTPEGNVSGQEDDGVNAVAAEVAAMSPSPPSITTLTSPSKPTSTNSQSSKKSTTTGKNKKNKKK